MNPGHHIIDAMHFRPVWEIGAIDHQDCQAKGAGSVEFGAGTGSARVLRDDEVDIVVAHQIEVVSLVERATGDNGGVFGQRDQFNGRVDETQEEMVLRCLSEKRDVLATDGEKDPLGGFFAQIFRHCFDIGEILPVVAVSGHPRGAGKGGEMDTGFAGGGDGISAHTSGEWMGGVDQMGDLVFFDISGQAVCAAKTSPSHGDRLRDRVVDATGIAERRGDSRFGNALGQCAGFGRAAKDQEVRGNV